MSKLVFVTQLPSELIEGVNVLEVAYTTNGKPSPYNNEHNLGCIFVDNYEGADLEHEDASIFGVNKYEADVEVSIDKFGKHSFKLVGDIRLRKNIDKTSQYLEAMDVQRAKEYKDKVDSLTLEKLRKQLNDKEINELVKEIKVKFPK